MNTRILFLPAIAASLFTIFSLQNSNNAKVEKFRESSSHKNANGAPTAKTGAPGENNCTQCHAGTVLAGANQNILKVFDGATEVFSYVPGTTYKVSLALATGNVREGFGATVLENSGNTAAGSFPGTGLVGTQTSSASGRFYSTQTSSSNTEGNVAWEWDWVAPATDEGAVTFYVASNKANGSGTGGDQIYVSQHVFNSSLSVAENEINSIQFQTGFNSKDNELMLNYVSLAKEKAFVNIVDLSGKIVFTKHLGDSNIGVNKEIIQLNDNFKRGTYIVHFFLGNTPATSKIVM